MQQDKNTPKILILGAKGMLGHDLAKVFESLNPVLWDKEDLDITDKDAAVEKIGALKPDIVINAAAYTAVDDCETNRDLAVQVNGVGVGHLAQACKNNNALLVHYSTDYVFDGNNERGYKEDDAILSMPDNIYGKSKFLGEQFIKEIAGGLCAGCNHGCGIGSSDEDEKTNPLRYYIIRTSWLYGKNGPNFVDKISFLIREKGSVKVVNDQFGKPTYTLDLARGTKQMIEGKHESGVYHITNETEDEKGISWFDFALSILEIGKLDGRFTGEAAVFLCSSDEFPRPAKRPKYSMLINTKLPKTRRWQEALHEYMTGA